jgi:hypothetical protein
VAWGRSPFPPLSRSEQIGVTALLGALLLLFASPFAWIAFEVWRYEHRGADLPRNLPKIKQGMTLEEVNSLLGMAGKRIDESNVPRVVDDRVPLDDPKRLKPVVSGESFYRWESNGTWIIVSLKNGVVYEKDFYEPSL